ncbi:MAG: STAS domain-containing protein [Candidatus Margulisiibacteriota bacterium]|jgi:hypothetical protein
MEDIEIKEEKGYILINISGDVELEDAANIGKLLDNYILEDHSCLAFQLLGSGFLDSAALAMFASRAMIIAKTSGIMGFVAIPLECLSILKVTKLDGHFFYVNSEEELKTLVAQRKSKK